MSVYCTVQEAWGQNFGRNDHFNPSSTLSYDKNDDDTYKKEGFADIQPLDSEKKLFTNQGQIIYRPGDEYTHDSKKYATFRNPNYYKNDYLKKVPDSYDRHEDNSSQYYDFKMNSCENPKNRSLNYTYSEAEQQHFPGKNCNSSIMLGKPKEDDLDLCDSDLCDNVTKHIMHCKSCQKSIMRVLHNDLEEKEHFVGQNRDKQKKIDEDNENELDFTEIVLFVMCGIFFIFLLDSIISIGKRFK